MKQELAREFTVELSKLIEFVYGLSPDDPDLMTLNDKYKLIIDSINIIIETVGPALLRRHDRIKKGEYVGVLTENIIPEIYRVRKDLAISDVERVVSKIQKIMMSISESEKNYVMNSVKKLLMTYLKYIRVCKGL